MEFQIQSQGYRAKGLTADMGRVIRTSVLSSGRWFLNLTKGFFLFGSAAALVFGLYLVATGEGGQPFLPTLWMTALFWPVLFILARQGGDLFYGWAALHKSWKLPDPSYTVTFGPDHIQLEDFAGTRPMAYNRVDALYRTKLGWYVGAGQHGFIVVRRSDFARGGPDQFQDFIQRQTGRTAREVKWKLL